MNRDEALALNAMIDMIWGERPGHPEVKAAVWADVLADVPFDVAAAAVKALGSSQDQKFPPSVPDIKRKIAEHQDGIIPSWVEVKSLIEHSHYDPEALRSAHPVARVVASKVGGATTLAAMSPSEAERVVRAAVQYETARYAASESEQIGIGSGRAAAIGRGGLLSIDEALGDA